MVGQTQQSRLLHCITHSNHYRNELYQVKNFQVSIDHSWKKLIVYAQEGMPSPSIPFSNYKHFLDGNRHCHFIKLNRGAAMKGKRSLRRHLQKHKSQVSQFNFQFSLIIERRGKRDALRTFDELHHSISHPWLDVRSFP